MMTKTTLKALWVGGGGVLATWLAVAPEQSGPAPAAPLSRPSVVNGPSAEMLNAQAEKLRARTAIVALGPSTRNPFRFSAAKTTTPDRRALDSAPAAVSEAVVPAPPALTLSGIAEKKTPEGMQRTAVLSSDGQIYLVKEGDAVAAVFSVVRIDSEAVLLRNLNGAELRLVLR